MSKASDLRRKFYDNFIFIKNILDHSESSRYMWGIDISLSNPALTIYDVVEKSYDSYSHKFKGSFYQRIKRIEESFRSHVLYSTPQLVLIEGYAYSSGNKREILGEVSYAVKRQLVNSKNAYIPCLIVPPLTLKKFVLERPSQGVKKNDIHKIIKNDWGARTRNNDESDSYALCMMGVFITKIVNNIDVGQRFDDKKIMKLLKKSPIKSMSDSRWSALCSVIMNDGENIKRFFIET